MGIISTIQDALEEVTSLQVATLYGSGIVVSSGVDGAAKTGLEKRIAEQEIAVGEARNKWLAATEMADRFKTRSELRAAKSKLNELKEELSGVNPRDIFPRIRLAIGASKTAGYTQLQLGGNGTHYYDSSLGADLAYLLDAHQANVKAAQETREKLIELALGLKKTGEEI